MAREGGQAIVELVASLPALLLAGCAGFQLLAAGYALTLADGAAEAGALALAAGRPAAPASRDALPGWAAGGAGVRVAGGRVVVTVRPPTLVPGIGDLLTMTASAAARDR